MTPVPRADAAPRVLVVGLGSTLRGDDALGRVAAERARAAGDPRHVRVLDQCAPTPELAAELSGVDLAIFLDASVDGPDDEVVARVVCASDHADCLAHRVDLGELVALSLRLYGRAPECVALTWRGRCFDLADSRLSPQAERGADALARHALRLAAALPPAEGGRQRA